MPRTMRRQFMLPLVAACIFAGPARSAEVQLDLTEVEPGAWDLFAKVNPNDGDVLGLSGFAGNVVGVAPDEVSFELGNLATIDPVNYTPRGFQQLIAAPIKGGRDYFSIGANQASTEGNSEVLGIGIEPAYIDGFGASSIAVESAALLGQFRTPAGLDASHFSDFEVSLFPAGYAGLSSMPTQGMELGDAGFSLTITPYGGEPTVIDSLPSPTPYIPPVVELPEPIEVAPPETITDLPELADPPEAIEQPPVIDPILDPIELPSLPIVSERVDPVVVTPWLVGEGGIIPDGIFLTNVDLLEICDCRFTRPTYLDSYQIGAVDVLKPIDIATYAIDDALSSLDVLTRNLADMRATQSSGGLQHALHTALLAAANNTGSETEPVPEPTAISLAVACLLACGVLNRRARKTQGGR